MLRLFLLAALLVLQACTARKTLAGWGQAFYYVQADGQVYSFGRNVAGELGIGSTYDSRFPKQMLNVLFAMDAAAGSEFACIVDEGAAKCVGRSVEGQLGNGNETLPLSNKLVQVHGLNSGVDEVYTGHAHACARLTNGGAMCWGHNIFGALADNSQTTRLSPVAVVGFESGGVRDMALGSYNTCLLTLAGKVLCVGPNSYGQFDADSVGSYVLTMSPIIGLENNIRYVSISCGSGHTCVVNEVGETYCIGSNHYGQLGVAGHSGT